jgi:hypothetical protein
VLFPDRKSVLKAELTSFLDKCVRDESNVVEGGRVQTHSFFGREGMQTMSTSEGCVTSRETLPVYVRTH